MKTWKHIRRCICLIDPFNQLDTEVITRKYFRSQVQSVRKYRADDQKMVIPLNMIAEAL